MRPLILGPEQQEAINRVVAYAMDHRLDERTLAELEEGRAVGDTDGYTVTVPFGFKCVFSVEQVRDPAGRWIKRLSVSSPTPGRVPHEVAMKMLTEAFGMGDGSLNGIMAWLEPIGEGHNAVNMAVFIPEPLPWEAQPRTTETK